MAFAPATVNLSQAPAKSVLGAAFLDLLLRVEAWLDARAGRRALYGMDDQALADIGLTQADLGRTDPATSWHGLRVPRA